MSNPILPDTEWSRDPRLRAIVAALTVDGGTVRYVGGAVRDTLAGVAVTDVDLATPIWPAEVIARLEAAGLKAVPTGIDHGTITAVSDGKPYEVTTLRRDIATDGRRATVAFSDRWEEDAARRDFTINALFADPETREIDDFFGGIDDLRQGRVRFIGNAAMRIEEDLLRILRFFRFHARFGSGEPDAEAIAAATAKAPKMKALSRERIAGELLRLLALPDPADTVALMVDRKIFASIIPEIDEGAVPRLRTLIGNELRSDSKPNPILRLMAILPVDASQSMLVASRLKLSTAIRKRIGKVRAEPLDPSLDPRHLAAHNSVECIRDRWLLEASPHDSRLALERLDGWSVPTFPIKGGMIADRGIAAGPEIARLLSETKRRWVEEDFPGTERAQEILDQVLSEARQ